MLERSTTYIIDDLGRDFAYFTKALPWGMIEEAALVEGSRIARSKLFEYCFSSEPVPLIGIGVA